MNGTMTDNKIRCGWCTSDRDYVDYHDNEWGVPIRDTAGLYRLLSLEGMQAGLSWLTILRKRAAMSDAFFDFDIERLASSSEREVSNWLKDASIIRHRGKLEALIQNARAVQEVDDFAALIWSYAPQKQPVYKKLADVPASTLESTNMSKALKKAGFNFVGPTICYAFMQSAGLVNDHLVDCWRYDTCEKLQMR